MRISDVGNTVVYTGDLREYFLLVNDTSQVDVWLRELGRESRNGESESSLCRSPRGGINFPGLHLLSLCSFASCQGGKHNRLLGSELLYIRSAWFIFIGTSGMFLSNL